MVLRDRRLRSKVNSKECAEKSCMLFEKLVDRLEQYRIALGLQKTFLYVQL